MSKLFYFQQFSTSTISKSKTVLCVSTISKSKTVLFQIIQFRMSTLLKCQNSSILNNSVQHKYAVQIKHAV